MNPISHKEVQFGSILVPIFIIRSNLVLIIVGLYLWHMILKKQKFEIKVYSLSPIYIAKIGFGYALLFLFL
jgi:hypothetical protein